MFLILVITFEKYFMKSRHPQIREKTSVSIQKRTVRLLLMVLGKGFHRDSPLFHFFSFKCTSGWSASLILLILRPLMRPGAAGGLGFKRFATIRGFHSLRVKPRV